MADYNRRFAREPASPHDAHRPLRGGDNLDEVLRWKERRKLTNNLALHYKRSLYIVEQSTAALAARGQFVEVHELLDGTVRIRHDGHELAATPFRKDGQVRQQDVADNKYLASILERLRQAQISNDEKKLAGRGTKREKALLAASLEQRRASMCPPPPPSSQPPTESSPKGRLTSIIERTKRENWQGEMAKEWNRHQRRRSADGLG
jgi:hypothetical protein